MKVVKNGEVSFTCISDLELEHQAYIYVTHFTGSWYYNANSHLFKDKDYCKRVVREFVAEYGHPTPDFLKDTLEEFPELIKYWKQYGKL